MDIIYSIQVRQSGEDKLCRNPSSQNVFEVKSTDCYSLQVVHHFPGRVYGCLSPKVPTKVAYFIWTAALEKILTVDNLRKRHLIIIDWCCNCKLAGVARELWNMVFTLFGVHRVMLKRGCRAFS